MKYNKIVNFIVDSPHLFFEDVTCPYCESKIEEVYTDKPKCLSCGNMFLIEENGVAISYDDPLSSLGMKEFERNFFCEEISKIAKGRPGWKTVVATYHDPLKPETFDIFWSMMGSNTLFKNGDRVDLDAASRESMSSDPSNQTQYHYDPSLEQVNDATEIKSIINKYNLDSAGYSVSSFVISPDGTKVFSGAPSEAFDSDEAKPFFSALAQCIALRGVMASRYSPDPDLDEERLQIAINNFISDNPLILSLPTGNITPDEMGYLSDFTGKEEQMELPMGEYSEHNLIEKWGDMFKVAENDLEIIGDFDVNMHDVGQIPAFFYKINGITINVLATEHTGYRIAHPRGIDNKEIEVDDHRRITMHNLDQYVGNFVNYLYNIFPYEKNDYNSFLYLFTQYGFPLVFKTTKGDYEPDIVFQTINPIKGIRGNFDYRITDNKIKGGNKANLPKKRKR